MRDMAAAVRAYDAVRHPAPVVRGHPDDDRPVLGRILALRQDGSRLFATLSEMTADFLAEFSAGRWLNRSMAFWHPQHPSNPVPGVYYAKHLGMLGAAQPAIPGMDPMQFMAAMGFDEGSASTAYAHDWVAASKRAWDDATSLRIRAERAVREGRYGSFDEAVGSLVGQTTM